jgi:hypothetical protein
MLDHVSITVTNIGAAEKFYDAVMNALECQRTEKSACDLDTASGAMGTIQIGLYVSIKAGGQPDDAPARHWCFKARPIER